MNDRFESLESGEVISVQHDTQVLSGHRTFRVGELNDAIKGYLENSISGWSEDKNGWFNAQGIECEALRFGSNGWQKGRIRLCLEFCPDEPNSVARNAATSSIPTMPTHAIDPLGHAIDPTPTTHSSVATTITSHQQDSVDRVATESAVPTPIPPTESEVTSNNQHITAAIPMVAGIAAIGTVTAAAIAAPDLPEKVDPLPTVPPLADTVLEEHQTDPSSLHSGGLDEIAFDFDLDRGDRGIMIPNGMMELDLTDLGLDFSEHDLLSFEANGMSDASEELANLHDLGKPENSGMLIDEVWNEMNQGDWPGIN
jgi:KGK domain